MIRWLFLFILFPSLLFAKDFSTQGPFALRTQHPIYLQTINLAPSRAKSLSTGVFELRLDHAYSNLYERDTNANNDINLNMELERLGIVANYGFFPSMELGIEVPLIRFNGGFLDSFIQDFHHFFGVPNGGREFVSNGLYTYQINSGALQYALPHQEMNLGDITLSMKKQFTVEGEALPVFAFRFAFKLPTGDSHKAMGSGNPGAGFGFAIEKSKNRFHGYLNLDYLFEAGNDALENLMHNAAFHFSFAGEFSFSRTVSAIVQFDGGTPRLQGTGLEEWDGAPLDFIVGVAGDVKKFFWQVAFSEDIRAVGPSVDFTFFTTVGIRFPMGRGLYKGDYLARL